MKAFLIALMLASSSFSAIAAEQGPKPAPPVVLEKNSYASWLNSIQSAVSPFNDQIFFWFEEQKRVPLPDAVFRDPEKLYVSVERPLQETISLEEAGDIETGVTYGFEAYAIIDAPVNVAYEALMYKWGKPVGKPQGTTRPNDTVYGYRLEELIEQWGVGNYYNRSTKTNGGIAKDQHDLFTLLTRGNERDGYVLIGNFSNAFGPTATTSSISVVTFRPMPDGKTDYRVSSRHLGQSYAFFGIEFGRRNYGFNRDRIRTGVKEFISIVDELKRTGNIKDKN